MGDVMINIMAIHAGYNPIALVALPCVKNAILPIVKYRQRHVNIDNKVIGPMGNDMTNGMATHDASNPIALLTRQG